LLENVDLCPLPVREGFLCMAKQLPVKYPQVNVTDFLGSVIFFRFFCPAIIKPHQYGIMSDQTAPTPLQERNLVLVSKILQIVANGTPFDTSRSNASVFNSFIQTSHAKVKQFVEDSVDEKVIRLSRKVIEASVVKDPNAKENAIRGFTQYLEDNHIHKNVVLEAQFQQKFQYMTELIDSELKDWSLIKSSKKGDICTYAKKTEGTTLLATKSIGFTKDISFDKCKEHLLDHIMEIVMGDKRVVRAEAMERTETRLDWNWDGVLPIVSIRDCVMATHQVNRENEILLCGYSIERDDYPPKKGFVRMNMLLYGVKIQKNKEGVLVTYLYQLDLKGSIPIWVMNFSRGSSYTGFRNTLKKLIEKFGTSSSSSKSSKSKKSEKNNKK